MCDLFWGKCYNIQSGYIPNVLHALVEFRDERACFCAHQLTCGKLSASYRLPTKASAMYAPELKANSDEIKLFITG